MALKPFEHSVHPTFVQHPFNFCGTSVGQILKLFKQALRRTEFFWEDFEGKRKYGIVYFWEMIIPELEQQ